MLRILVFLFLFIYFSFSWYNPTLSQARYQLAATSVREIALFAGGVDGMYSNNVTNQVDIYNYSSNTWFTATLSQFRQQLSATTIANLALFAGGATFNSVLSNRVDIYNYSSNSWSTATLSQARCCNLAATTVGTLAIFAGGYYSDIYSNQVDIFNYSSNSWLTATLSQARSNLAATTVENLALFGGGWNGSFYFQVVDIYNYSSNSWFTTILSQGRWILAATTVYNLAIFAGGSNKNGYSSQVDIYNYSSNSWFTTTLSQVRGALVATTVYNLAIFAGGSNKNGYSSQVDIFNYSSNSWSTATLSQARSNLAATTVENLAFFAGGQINNITSSQVDIYDYLTNSWIPECPSGTFIDSIRPSIICQNCSVGTYSNITGSRYCNLCLMGTYSNQEGSSYCISCKKGTYSTIIGANSSSYCIPCKKGTYSDIVGAINSSTCNFCPSGTYSTIIGASNCTSCPSGTYSNITGAFNSSTCIPCPVGTYSNSGSIFCISSKSKLPIIIGSILGVTSFAIIAIILIILLWRKKKLKNFFDLNLNTNLILKNIEITERLGGGNFGEVYKGIWNETTEVALKKLKSKEYLKQFIQEAELLKTLTHPNIVQFFGIFNFSNEQYIVMEYLPKGSLDQVLIVEKNLLKIEDLLSISRQTAAGMQYLESKKTIHRDLALRNLLIAPGNNENEKYIIKISDFGLSRIIENNYYKTDNKTIPIRWSAPEILEKGIFSSKSDVWSFGIVLWEIFTFGKLPYFQFPTNSEVIEKVLSGYRLEKPENCPNEIYELMLQCWNKNYQERSSFKEIYQMLITIQKNSIKNKLVLPTPNSEMKTKRPLPKLPTQTNY